MTNLELKEFLDEKYIQFNNLDFIPNDPILIPHQFKYHNDIEVAGFFAAVIAWGNRKSIIKNALNLMRENG